MAFRFWNRPTIYGRKMILEALEERIVMDAAVDTITQENPFLHRDMNPQASDLSLAFHGVGQPIAMGHGLMNPDSQQREEVSAAAPSTATEDRIAEAVMPFPASDTQANAAAPSAQEKGLDVVSDFQ